MSGLRVAILGPLEVRDAAGGLVSVGGPRLRSFLIRLAIADGQPVSVDRLAEDLWPGDGPAAAANAVQALASRLRGAVGRDTIEYGPAGYRLAVAPGEIDARAFEQLVTSARATLAGGDQAGGAGLLRRALGLWRGPALADVADASFAGPAITRLSELRLAATEDRIEADLALGHGAALVPEVEELATEHPLRERLRGQLMRALYAAGRQADALRVYEDTRQALADGLGVDPSPALAAVHLAILRGELPAGSATDVSPVRSIPPTQHPPALSHNTKPTQPPDHPQDSAASAGHVPDARGNLPAQLTSFVGREDELARVAKLLAESRLVTLTGPGGAGKTRLSVEAAVQVAGQVPDGVWFVPLAPVRDALDVPQAVLAAIGAHAGLAEALESARLTALDPLDRLADVLAARRLLLVLDNCEHVLDAVAMLAARVLADAPGVRILATSREPLLLTGENLCPVPSLPLPPAGADVAEAVVYPSVRLFGDRAAAVRPGFTVDTGSLAAVLRICRALDGIPLAIELAAARVRSLTPEQVADRLDDRFALLSTGSRGVLPRHQTLRAIVDWSWDLLDDTERMVLRRLSVFSGGATPDSAEQVCPLDGQPAAVVDVIASLVDKSLVIAVGEREVRYRLLETVRAYAAERLEQASEMNAVSRAHGEYFLDLAERAEPRMRASDQLDWLGRLSAEHDNCSAALRYAISVGDVRTALRFVRALAWFWVIRDYDAEASDWAKQVLVLAGPEPPQDLAEAYGLCRMMGMMSRTGPDAEQMSKLGDLLAELAPLSKNAEHPLLALTVPMMSVFTGNRDAADVGMADIAAHRDPWVRAAERVFAGHLAINDGHIEEAAAALADGQARFIEIGDRWGLIVCLTGQAEVAMAQGRPADAVAALERAYELAREGMAGNWSETMRIPLGRAKVAAGDIAGGRADLEQGLRSSERIGEHDDAAMGYVELSELARREGDLARARTLLDSAREIVEPRRTRPDMCSATASAYTKLGCVAELNGDLEAAARWHAQALETLADERLSLLPSNPTLAIVLEGVAALSAARGEYTRAAELLGLAHKLQGFANMTSMETVRAREKADAVLSHEEFQAAYDRGRAKDRADALALTP
ncbi:MAG TPA: BTAD domain-containing putative transcriptional regulator [Streptosporangiaceae bacterium]|jgi:predicted ATPase/DNA-binding SARP family transcriptional activator